jgi:DNA (cytosine-5)-methyltransferase 1
MTLRRFHGPWNLTDLATVPKNGLTSFSCFHCGGGSTMGYKLAGFNMLGGVEIDPEMMAIYRANHKPKHSYLMGVQQFNKLPLEEIPDELKNLDLLDGSPPCSSFSMAGSREKKWGDAHHFREGQVKQVLDDLFFHFIDVGQRLQPKVIVAENVKGLILGNAKGYVKEIFAAFREAGYETQLFLFNAARMGVPQARERTFFIARRRSLGWKPLKIGFDEQPIPIGDLIPRLRGYRMITASNERHYAFGRIKNAWPCSTRPAPTQVATKQRLDAAKGFPGDGTFIEPISFNDKERILIQSFPIDYQFGKCNVQYVCGMSVPPFMTQRVALEIGRQWFGIQYDS